MRPTHAMHDIYLPVIVLAAGASSRMRGKDKLQEPVDGVPLLRHQVLKALQITGQEVLVALPQAPHPRYDLIADLDVTPVPVPDAAEGMNSSLRRSFAAVNPEAHCVMVLLADMPALTTDDLLRVGHTVDFTAGPVMWRGATEDGRPGHPIVIRTGMFPIFETLKDDAERKAVMMKFEKMTRLVPLEGNRARLDLDTPEDWERWRATQKK